MSNKKLKHEDVVKITEAFDILGKVIHDVAQEHGWWEKERNTGEAIALMHSELSEALEGDRAGNPPSEHIPEFSAMEEEFADTLIRIIDFGEGINLNVSAATIAKIEFNNDRPHKHGGKQY